MMNSEEKIKKYDRLLCEDRMRKSTQKRETKIEEFYSDRSRIIYSSSFRRLQQKAQVFSLEPNSSVRTRLTHSIEVSDLGKTLANKIAHKLAADNKLSEENIPSLVAVVENACLLHDIGNPPFGHFGEAAIRDWANKTLENIIPKDSFSVCCLLKKLLTDFYEFDGNPQGFRTVTKLYNDIDEHGLNLTFATLLCILKYPRAAGDMVVPGVHERIKEIFKKPGYFQTEDKLVKEIYEKTGLSLNHRYPFVYIMEAADDIAYCVSDIADAIEKGILTVEEFISAFQIEWTKAYEGETIPVKVPEIDKSHKKLNFSQDISIPWSKQAMKEAVEQFINHEDEVFNGVAGGLIDEESPMGKVLKTIKTVSRKKIYISLEAENIEITGYAVITGILEKFSCILRMPEENFHKLVYQESISGYEYEKRLFNRIGDRYIAAYKSALEKIERTDEKFLIKEWWLRIHLIVDHVSGMTDEYALETYQMLEGIRLMR